MGDIPSRMLIQDSKTIRDTNGKTHGWSIRETSRRLIVRPLQRLVVRLKPLEKLVVSRYSMLKTSWRSSH